MCLLPVSSKHRKREGKILLSGLRSSAHQSSKQQIHHWVASACGNLRERLRPAEFDRRARICQEKKASQHAPHNQAMSATSLYGICNSCGEPLSQWVTEAGPCKAMDAAGAS